MDKKILNPANAKYYLEFRGNLKFRNYSDATIKTYCNHVLKLLSVMEKPLEAYTSHEHEIIWLQIKADLSQNTKRNMQVCLKMFYKDISKKYVGIPDIFKGQKAIKEDIVEPDIPSHDDIFKMAMQALQQAGTNDVYEFLAVRNAAIIVFLADTGLRNSEMLRVTFADIHERDSHYEVNVPRLKNSPGRIVPFGYLHRGALVGEFFTRYYMMMKYHYPDKFGYKFNPLDPLFPTTRAKTEILHDQPMRPQATLRMVQKTAKLAGVKKMHPHLFRHYYGTYSYLNGVKLAALMHLMGHRTVTTTERYVHIADKLTHTIQQQPTYTIKIPRDMQGNVALQQSMIKKKKG